jgi:FMN-dependent NADH-azoreductase
VAGKTFRYGPTGPEGLAGNKRVIVTIARGGFYGPDAPAAVLEHLESHLRGVFAFIGVTKPELVVAEGLQSARNSGKSPCRAHCRRSVSFAPPEAFF